MRLSRHALAVAFALGGIGTAAADDAKDEIRIGQTLPYSGPVSGFGIIGRAQEAYFAKINAEGGINGRKVKFISPRRRLFAAQDGRADPQAGGTG